MRKKDKEITIREQIDEIIHGSQVCRLALAADDLPYLVPVSFGYDGSAIYLHTALEGKKIQYFESNNRVCFEFERNVRLLRDSNDACKWSFSYESVIGNGTIHELVNTEQKEYGLNQIMLQYSGKQWKFKDAIFSKARVWKISIDSLTGRRSKEEAT